MTDLYPEPDDIQDDGSDEDINDENPEDPDDSNTEDTNSPPALDVVKHGFGASARTYPILEQIISYFPGRAHVYVTATTGGTHATNSYHYRGEAIDVGSSSQTYKDQLAAWLYAHSSHITELIHSKAGNNSGWYVKNGSRVSHEFYGSKTTAAHVNHVHFAIASVSQANAMLAAVRVASGSSSSHPTLNKGANGSAVRTLQSRLNAHGAKIAVDGDFGNSTLNAVKAFQKANKLSVDGEVGNATWVALLK